MANIVLLTIFGIDSIDLECTDIAFEKVIDGLPFFSYICVSNIANMHESIEAIMHKTLLYKKVIR